MRSVPLTKPYFTEEELQNVKLALDSGWVAQGSMVRKFEAEVAKHENSKFAVATSSCTTALHMALLAKGIGRNDDVFIPAFTFVATANAVEYTGATPILIDIMPETFNIAPEKIEETIIKEYFWDKDVHSWINKRTKNKLKAILVVHQFGLCADMNKINLLRDKYGLVIIEDAACALGAHINKRSQGTFGNISCVSFHPRKCITTGEGGMIFTDDEKIYSDLIQLRSHGAEVSELSRHQSKGGFLLPSFPKIGYNYRMSDIQGAVGNAQIKKLDYILATRRKGAQYYNEKLNDEQWLLLPSEPEGFYHTYQSYVCMLLISGDLEEKGKQKRNQIMLDLEKAGIQTRQGTHAIHMLDYYKDTYGYNNDDFPNARDADWLSIALPLFADIKIEEQEYVVEKLKDAIRKEI